MSTRLRVRLAATAHPLARGNRAPARTRRDRDPEALARGGTPEDWHDAAPDERIDAAPGHDFSRIAVTGAELPARDVEQRAGPAVESLSLPLTLSVPDIELDSQPGSPESDIAEKSRDSDAPEAAFERVIEQGTPQPLPQRDILEELFGQSLGTVTVFTGPEARAALAASQAAGAAHDRRIVLADSRPDLLTLAHEVVHLLQTESAAGGGMAKAEHEARALAGRIADRAAQPDPGDFAPLSVEAVLAPEAVAFQSADADAAAIDPAVSEERARELTRAAEGPAPREEERPTPPESTASTAGDSTPAPADSAGGQPPAPEEAAGPGYELPPPPAPGVSAEEVADREAELAAAREALAGAENVDAVVEQFAAAPPTAKAQVYGQLGDTIGRVSAEEDQAFQGEVPEFHAQLNSQVESVEPLDVRTPEARAVEVEAAPPPPAPALDLPPTPDPGRYTGNDGLRSQINSAANADDERRAQAVGETLRDVRTSDSELAASPGPPPTVPLEGETDLARLENQRDEGVGQARQVRDEARQALIDGPGPEQVQPVAMDEVTPVGELLAPELTPPGPVDGPQAYLDMNLPPEVQTAFDQNEQAVMQASLSDAQTSVQTATAERDQARQTEIETAEQQAKDLSAQADQQQQAEVMQARGQIQTERQNTIEAQNQAVSQMEGDVESRRSTDRQAIDTRVSTDQQTINGRYAQAESDAQAEIDRGERDARQEKERAERDAANQSWWDRAVGFLKSAFEALTSAINAIFDAVRSAVNRVLDAVKSFAEGLIDRLASFIKNAISVFGEYLKGLVNTLLGDIFPGLARALNEAIDSAVELAHRAVDAVAEGLKAGINALVEGLRGALNAIINAYQAAVNLAVGMVQAALTGDWAALARMAFEAVLKVAGIDPQEVYAFIGRAQEIFQIIMDDPGAFVGHVLDAVVQGIRKFADNFLTHLQAGIIGWLTGTLGGAGITLPERFDLWGVLDLIRQILGLTYDRLRQKAVRLIGEQNVARIEFVADYLRTLITGGWAGLWERIQNDLATLRDQVLDGIKEFLLTRIVMAAITKLATMFNPVGAIVQLVITAYNIYTFLRDQLQRIIQVVQTVVNAIGDIARGVIEPAAQRVESVLASLLPLAIDLLARVMGLGNVGAKVREIIERVQGVVDRALDRLIERVMALFRGGGAGAAPGAPAAATAAPAGAAGAIGERLPIPVQGQETHHLFIEARGRDALVMVASEPRPLTAVLTGWRGQLNLLEEHRAAAAAQRITQAENLLTKTDRDADVIAAARQPEGAGAAPASGGSPATLVQDEQQLVAILREIYPLFVPDTSTPAQRFERAQSHDPFHQIFNRQQWQTFFELGERQAQDNLKWGRDNNKLDQPNSGRPEYRLRLPDDDLVALAGRLIGAQGRISSALGGGKPYFTLGDVQQFCIDNERLPNDANRYNPAILSRIGTLLLRRDDVIHQPDGDHYIFKEVPARRTLPDNWTGADVRQRYYVRGSGFDAMRQRVIREEFPRVQTAVANLLSADTRLQAQGRADWNQIRQVEIVPNEAFDPARQALYLDVSQYDVDHITPLAQHWEVMSGNNMDEADRLATAGGRSNLRLMWASSNRARQAEGARYVRYVGAQFATPVTKQHGPQWADTGIRFKDYN